MSQYIFVSIYRRVAGLLAPVPADAQLPPAKATELDRLYRAVAHALDNLVEGVGLKAA